MLDIYEITGQEYEEITDGKCTVFSSYSFLSLNGDKVDKIRFFLGKNKKRRIALAVGEKDNKWLAPFSAPFSDIVELQKDTEIGYFWSFFALLNDVAQNNGIKKISFYLPPEIYLGKSNAKIYNALWGTGYKIEYLDVNYAFDLNAIDLCNYELQIEHNARKNLRISQNAGLDIIRCTTEEEKIAAYEVIRLNRLAKGYPLRMSLQQVLETIKKVKHEFFLVKKDDINIASAMVYYVNEKVAQVVYWGNISNTEMYKPINFLSYELIKYYKEQGLSYLDIGISTEEGIPNYGLCSFKESIGCEWNSKIKWSKSL